MKFFPRSLAIALSFLAGAQVLFAFQPPNRPSLPNLDKRSTLPAADRVKGKETGLDHLKKMLPATAVDLDPVLGTVHLVAVRGGFLTGANGSGPAISARSSALVSPSDPNHAARAFLEEHKSLFGHGSEVLDGARVKRDDTTAHNGLHTMVWEQQVDGIGVFGGTLIAHTTRKGELVNLSSHFLAKPSAAADTGTANRLSLQVKPMITAEQAIILAAAETGETVATNDITGKSARADAEKRGSFQASHLDGEVTAHLTWLPMSANSLRLCWEIVFVPHSRGEMFRSLVDAQTGEILVRHNLTSYLSDATYRVYTSDSPTPFSPGYLAPLTVQPSTVSRNLITTNAFDTNASPNGWINDGVYETQGNNVDAHTDHTGHNQPDLPRPQGGTNRVFDFSLDLSQNPTNYADAAVTQLFFLCNWYHDRMYELGFTEAAGNFQNDNFGRGGDGNDAVQADAQDGSDFNNANFNTPSDGSPGRMQMFIFTGPNPRRDGDLDAEVIFHEHTHGVSNRLIGGGVGITAQQPAGMGEGWSDFIALSLLSEPTDDVDASYPFCAYVSYLLSGSSQNYYYGLRHYPYSTDLSKNPLTFKDIDPTQLSLPPEVPINPALNFAAALSPEVHAQGEIWGAMLWEARASLIKKYGWATGNQLAMQLVIDGLKLSPANPNFTEARDAIIQADMVDSGGANTNELWAAFAKRGLGFFAYAPDSSTTTGVIESFAIPDDLFVAPQTGFNAQGRIGGPFTPNSQICTLTNTGTNTLHWTAGATNDWLIISPAGGALGAGASTTATVTLNHTAFDLSEGIYKTTMIFTNTDSGVVQPHRFTLNVGLDYLTQNIDSNSGHIHHNSFTFTPDNSINVYAVCRQAVTNFPANPSGSTRLPLGDDSSIGLALPTPIPFFGSLYSVVYVDANGSVTFGGSDQTDMFHPEDYFYLPRVSGWCGDLNPGQAGTVSAKTLSDRFVVTYQKVPEFSILNTNNFQIELFYNGTIRLTYLQMDALSGIVGLSQGLGIPVNFIDSDFSSYDFCQPVPLSGGIAGTNVVLSWPARGGAYTLQQATDMANWSTVTNQPYFNGSQFIVTNTVQSNRFFRLRN